MSTPHIESKSNEISKYVLMPGDPERVKYIAENFLTDIKLVNTVRGEIAYTGKYKGREITVFSSGMGIPSMGIYSHELFDKYDVDVIIRIGTAGSYTEDLKLKSIFLAESAYSDTCYDEETLNKSMNIVNSSFELNSVIIKTAEELGIDLKLGRVHTTEAFYTALDDKKYTEDYDCKCVEMETFSLLVNAKKFHKQATSLLTISDMKTSNESLSREDRVRRLNTMINLALESIIKLQ